MGDSVEFETVDWITAGAVGAPGARTFYLQARQGERLVALLLEKGQVQALGQFAQELLARVGTLVTPDDLDETGQRIRDEIEPLWRAGQLGLGMEADGERFLLEVAELLLDDEGEDEDEDGAADEGGSARFWLNRDQLVTLAAYAAYIVEAGARERCRYCDRPIDPVEGHVCPAMNGHGPLTS